MKILNTITIGDLHGRDVWKQVDIEKYDKIIFIGDYVDSFTLSPIVQKENLLEIIKLKQKYPDKIVLLLGNHDMQYLCYPKGRCPGFQAYFWQDYTEVFKEYKKLFQLAYQIENYIWTHAGITNGWLQWVGIKESKKTPLAYHLNEMIHNERYEKLFSISAYRGGMSKYGSIICADKHETIDDHLIGYHQIVGHTPIKEITKIKKENSSITYIDCQDFVIAFHEETITVKDELKTRHATN